MSSEIELYCVDCIVKSTCNKECQKLKFNIHRDFWSFLESYKCIDCGNKLKKIKEYSYENHYSVTNLVLECSNCLHRFRFTEIDNGMYGWYRCQY